MRQDQSERILVMAIGSTWRIWNVLCWEEDNLGMASPIG